MRNVVPVLVVAAAIAACDRQGAEPCAFETVGAPWLAFASNRAGTFDLWMARADGSCGRQLTSGVATELAPSFGKGGRIAYSSNRSGETGVWIHEVATGQDWAVAAGTLASTTSPAFSPDGTRIAFEGLRTLGAASDIFVVPSGGGDPVQLTTSAANDSGPVFAPDGATIYFVSARDGYYDVYAVPAAGGPDVRVTNRSGILGRPAISPDGKALYYARSGAGGYEVVRRTLATGVVQAVTSQSDTEPSLSPDGDRLAVRSLRSGFANVFVVSARDGSAAVQITADEASAGAPSFAPAP